MKLSDIVPSKHKTREGKDEMDADLMGGGESFRRVKVQLTSEIALALNAGKCRMLLTQSEVCYHGHGTLTTQ